MVDDQGRERGSRRLAPEALLEMQGIRKSFSGVEVLHGVDFVVQKGEVAALCGENGAGKSTLMRILAGVYQRNDGSIWLNHAPLASGVSATEMQGLGVSMIHQELNLFADLTVAQNIFLCREPISRLGLIDYLKMNEDSRILLERLGERIDPTAKVSRLKIAQQQMVEIAKAISFNVELLILDEPTAVLTGKETEVLFRLLRELSAQGIASVYISHRLKEIADVCDTVTILRDGRNVSRRVVSDVSIKEIATMMVGRELRDSIINNYAGHQGETVLEVRNISDGQLKNVSFELRRGEVMGFSGLVGSGRSELMEIVFGIRKASNGDVLVNGKFVSHANPRDAIASGIGFVTEDRKETGLVLCRNITENTNYVYWLKATGFWLGNKAAESRVQKMIERLSISCTGTDQGVAYLSGGNQQKVVLAKWMLSSASILILDEPTRGVDVGAREQIYGIIQRLVDDGCSVILVSSDLPEILALCHRTAVMHEGRLTGILERSEMSESKIMHLATNV